ncbi:MAG: T9SS type A sorting domain-containing protein [Candidatus Krumholzibacteriota bacterium]|nr:T9SS type A sorting domain-containing protein [Candidatus Krumholzibacteriota bacterium]
MKSPVLFLSTVLILLTVNGIVLARDTDKKQPEFMQEWAPEKVSAGISGADRILMAPASVDTYLIVKYDFSDGDWLGFSRFDHTAQVDTFFHVDDFAGIGPGVNGMLSPIEGSKSIWCGARPGSDQYLCSWNSAPGYGNGWDQRLVSEPFEFHGTVTISFHGRFDSEAGFDSTVVEYNGHSLNPWTELASFAGEIDTVATESFIFAGSRTKIRFRFLSDGAWSDEDGLFNTDGAAIIDSITISDGFGIIDYEDFESAEVGDRATGFWQADVREPFGCYSSLIAGLCDKDPCNEKIGYQMVFFNQTCMPSVECPGLYVTPFCTETTDGIEVCQDESAISPVIDMTRYSTGGDSEQDAAIAPSVLPDLGGVKLKFTVYRDLPYSNLVFYDWSVRGISGGCPQDWRDRGFGYGGLSDDYYFSVNDISDLVSTDSIQVRLKVVDMCDIWFGLYGNCAEHTTSPYFNNIAILRYDSSGPQWYYRALDLFQDNFPSDGGDIENWVRADAANDLRSNDDPVVDPGDSIVVDCTSPMGGGIEEDGNGARVFMHVKCSYIGDPGAPKPALSGPSLEGTYGTYISDDGTWTVIQGDTARTRSGHLIPDKYMFDLNDSLFTRGYMIEYYFKAFDNAGKSSTLPAEAETAGEYPHPGGSYHFEFTCLPTLGSEILYVDDYDGRGTFEGTAQVYWDNTFSFINDTPDRYDVNSPSSLVGNGPGSRATLDHLLQAYEEIIWDSGNLSTGTITEGTDHSDKSNDAQLLYDWLDFKPEGEKANLFILGDGVASDLDNSGAQIAIDLMATACGVTHVNYSYYQMTGGNAGGGIFAPLVTGLDIYAGLSYHALGGCPVINNFDVLTTTGTGVKTLQLPSYESTDYYIGVRNQYINSFGGTARTSWIGHSLMYVRDEGSPGPIARQELFKLTQDFFENGDWNTGTDPVPVVYALAQNYPNPFNPSTRIRFDLPAPGHVNLSVYNASGQLVKTLTDREWVAGSHSVDWKGTNNAGAKAASGIYFYRIDAEEFSSTKKMVLLR